MADEEPEDDRTIGGSDDPPSSFSDLKESLGIGTPRSSSKGSRSLEGNEKDPIDGDKDSYLADLVSEITSREEHSSWDEIDRESDSARDLMLSDSKSQAIIELLGDTVNVLVLGPLLCPADYQVGTTLMGIGQGEEVNLLLVTFSQTPDERLSVCRAYVETIPEQTTIVGVGNFSRSSEQTKIETEDRTITVETVPDPADLKRIGITIDKTISRWEESGRRTIVCFHSLTALLQFVDDPRRVFRFLNILRSRVQNSNAHAHYHMERDAHDEHLVRTLRPLFDAVVRYDESGSVSIET